ncbi:MAG: hypothetical protein AMXMBFR47_18380 [Planctomycetota bacterium]
MDRLSRRLRNYKWVGTGFAAMLLALGVVSMFFQLSVSVWKLNSTLGVGALSLAWPIAPHAPRAQSYGWLTPRDYWALAANMQKPGFSQRTLAPGLGYSRIDIPLWLPLSLIAIPTLWLWRRDSTGVRPGCCRQCGYDLTGNVSGKCPECGASATPGGRAGVTD